MKTSSLLLIPVVVLFVSACAAGPGGPGYVDYGPGPSPRAGYYWNGTIYVQGENPYYHRDQYNRSQTNVNDVNINRTNVNEETVNRTHVKDRTVNQRTVNRTNVNQPNAKGPQTNGHKKTHEPNPADQKNQQGQPGNQ